MKRWMGWLLLGGVMMCWGAEAVMAAACSCPRGSSPQCSSTAAVVTIQRLPFTISSGDACCGASQTMTQLPFTYQGSPYKVLPADVRVNYSTFSCMRRR